MTVTSTPTGVLVPRLEPGTDEWMRHMSASKIAAVVGLSPWESKFSLYHRMAGLVPREETSDVMARGHYLEPAIAAWFADQHPDMQVTTTGTFLHRDRTWQAATPDRLGIHPDGAVDVVECKSAGDAAGWGEPGTDEIPIYYRCQVMWQLDTLGLDRCHVAVILPHLTFAEYVIDYDADEARILRDAAEQFLADLHAGQRPDIDDSTATHQVVRELHPDIDGSRADVPDDLAITYLAAVAAEKAAKDEKRAATSQMLDHMGDARDAYWNGTKIAYRMAKNGDTPYLCAARGATDQLRSAAA